MIYHGVNQVLGAGFSLSSVSLFLETFTELHMDSSEVLQTQKSFTDSNMNMFAE